MRQLYLLKPIIALIVFTFLLSSCKWGAKREAPKGKNIICVVDFSHSKNAVERLQFYKTVIQDNIIPKLGLNDKIAVIPIDKASITNSSDILLKDLSTKNFEPDMASNMELDQITNANLNKYKDTLQIEFASNFQIALEKRDKSNQGTDIFGALEVVKGKLKTRDDNYLIMLSDMMNWSSTLIMEPSNNGFNSKMIDNILSKLPNNDMPNTTVLVLTGEQVEVTPEHFKLVQTFWEKYFNKNNIKIYDYNSASLFKLNEIMNLVVDD
jgi:hypothetical protein